MSREIVLYCTDQGQHDRHDVHTIAFPAGVAPGEPVDWSPVFRSEVLTLRCGARSEVQGRVVKCPRVWRLSRRTGGPLLGELERTSRVSGRAERDISYLRL